MAIWKFAVETVRKVSLPFQRRRNFTDKYIYREKIDNNISFMTVTRILLR